MKMSKILILALAACILCAALVSCGGDNTTTTAATTTSSTGEPAVPATITFYGPGDDPVAVATVNANVGDALPTAPAFTGLASGETFVGWFTEPAGEGTEYAAGTEIEGNMTFYAHVRVPADMIDIMFKNGDDITTVQIEKGTAVGAKAPADPVKAGNKFVGWFNGDDQFDPAAALSAATVFEARFEAAYHIVIKNGDTVVSDQYITPDDNPDKHQNEDDKTGHLITVPADPVAPAGQIFLGWFDEEGRQLKGFVANNWKGYVAYKDSVFTARFAEAHTVTFVNENGDTISTVTVADGANAPIPAAPSGFYYDFMLDQVVNIKADKMVQLTTVSVSGYTTWQAGMTSNNSDDRIVLDGLFAKPYADIFVAEGNKVTFTVNAIGTFSAYIGMSDGAVKQQNVNGQYFVFNITVDGIDMGEFVGDVATRWTDILTLPSGEHTIVFELVEIVGGTADASCGYLITAAKFNIQ